MMSQNRARLKLIGIFMLFLGPLALSYGLYYGLHGFKPGAATNKGELLTPAQPLPDVTLNGADGTTTSTDVFRQQWTFLQVAPEGCNSSCRDSLDKMHQVWLLLHDERTRVQRVLFVDAAAPRMNARPGLEVYSGELQPLRLLIEKHDAAQAGTVYLVDPHGNWVLYYPPERQGKGLFEDTKHLLGLSHIG